MNTTVSATFFFLFVTFCLYFFYALKAGTVKLYEHSIIAYSKVRLIRSHFKSALLTALGSDMYYYAEV